MFNRSVLCVCVQENLFGLLKLGFIYWCQKGNSVCRNSER